MVTETDGELVGYWSFDQEDRVKDLSGNGHNGIIHGNPMFVDGKIGEALEFNGSNERLCRNSSRPSYFRVSKVSPVFNTT